MSRPLLLLAVRLSLLSRPRSNANADGWMNDAGSFGCHVPARCGKTCV
jgi:hypothetical protein